MSEVTTRTVELAAITTAYTSSTAPTTVYQGTTLIYGSKSMYGAYMKFDAPTLEATETVVSAYLSLNVVAVGGSGNTVLLVEATDTAWSSVTHNVQPANYGQVNIDTDAPAGKVATIGLDLSDIDIRKGISLVARNTVSGAQINITATGDLAPKLTLAVEAPVPEPEVVIPSKLVFAHYFPPYPISLDNKAPASDYYAVNYLQPSGENGKFASVGGLLRDRPTPRQPLSGDYKLQDMETEIRNAIAGGIDGFAVDILSLSGPNWDRTITLMKAATNVSDAFKIMIQLDATASAGKASDADIARALNILAQSPAVFKLPDGRVVLSPFKAENKTASQWQGILDILKNTYKKSFAFLPLFLDANKMPQYDSISFGFGNWGSRDPLVISRSSDMAKAAHKLGKIWMQPVAVQDVRPNQKLYDEAANTGTLRESWAKVFREGADWVLLPTWNDYSENTSFAPSVNHGEAFLTLNKYFIHKFKTGEFPTLETENVIVTHRVHAAAFKPTYAELSKQWSGTRSPLQDNIEVLTLLRGAYNVAVTTSAGTTTYTAQPGLFTCTVPLAPGFVSVKVECPCGKTSLEVATKDEILASPTKQDMSYHAVMG